MHRRRLFMTFAAVSLMAGSAYAETVADQISRQLRNQGFGQVSVTQTWLGRTRIIGQSDKGQREIIVNPKTGEILRDLFTGAGGSVSRPVIGNTGSGRRNSGTDDDPAQDPAEDAEDAADDAEDAADDAADDAEDAADDAKDAAEDAEDAAEDAAEDDRDDN